MTYTTTSTASYYDLYQTTSSTSFTVDMRGLGGSLVWVKIDSDGTVVYDYERYRKQIGQEELSRRRQALRDLLDKINKLAINESRGI